MWCWKLAHAVVGRNLSRGECRVSCGHGCAEWESRRLAGASVIRFLQAHEILGYLAEETSSRVEFFCRTTMRARILLGRQKPCCVSISIRTSSSILYRVRIWHRRALSYFQKWRSTLLVNASQMMKTWRILVETMRRHGMKRVCRNWCQGTTSD